MSAPASSVEKIGLKVGFGLSYLLFSALLFYMLLFLGKISFSLTSLFFIFMITLTIVTLGGLIQKFVL